MRVENRRLAVIGGNENIFAGGTIVVIHLLEGFLPNDAARIQVGQSNYFGANPILMAPNLERWIRPEK